MNRLNTSFLILTILLSYAACKKDVKVKPEDSPTILPCDLNTPTFSRPINTNDDYYSIVEDLQRNIVILGQHHLLKYDYQGDLVWSKDISLAGTPQNIIQADGDNYFTTNSTIDISSQTYDQYYSDNPDIKGKELRLTSYWRTAYSYPLPNCQYPYNRVQKDFGEDPDVYTYAEKPVNNSKSYLNKFDTDGKLLWTKTFDGNYFSGKNVCKTADGNFALITLKVTGSYQTVTFDDNGVFQDTIKSPINENTITVYKFDRNGSIIWSKTIDGILVSGYQAKDFLNYTTVHLAAVENTLFIQTMRSLFILNENGNLIKSVKPYGSDCRANAYGLSSYNDLVYSTGSYNAAGHYNFVTTYDGSGSVRQQIPCDNMLSYPITLAMSDGIIFISPSFLSKTDMNDNPLWSVQINYPPVNNPANIACANRTCREGTVYVAKVLKGKATLVKTDRNGLY